MSAFATDRLAEMFGNDVARDGDATTLTHRFGGEDFLRGHFPGFPIVPGVILLDGMMLTAFHGVGDAAPVREVAVDAVTFHRPVLPGRDVRFTARIAARREGEVALRCAVMVDGARHARAGMIFRLASNQS